MGQINFNLLTDPNYKYLKLKMAQKGMPLNKAEALWE